MSETWFWVLVIWVAPGLFTYYLTTRIYSRRLRQEDLGKDWDPLGVACFAAWCGVIWPLALLYQAAKQPTREERKVVSAQRVHKMLQETERKAKALGVGISEDDECDY